MTYVSIRCLLVGLSLGVIGYLGKSSGFVSTVVSVQHLLHLLSSLQEFLSGFTFTPLTILGG
jgi:hypothetical protein